MKILVETGYKYGQKYARIIEVKEDQLPFDVAPGMVCEKLNRLPGKGEEITLGLSIPHHYPSDVVVSSGEGKKIVEDWEDGKYYGYDVVKA